MPNFISPLLLKQTLSPPQYETKVKLTKDDVKLNFLFARDNGLVYKLQYTVQILPRNKNINPSLQLTVRNLDMIALREAILGNIPPNDLKYVILESFDDIKAIFRFDVNKWLKDSTIGLKPEIYISRFDRVFKFKISPPRIIMYDPVSSRFDQFIIRSFKNWLEESRNSAKYFKYLFPEKQRSKIRQSFRNMFEWSYDSQWNKIVSTLKPIYILALLYATGAVIKNLSTNSIPSTKRQFFSVNVEKNLPSFDEKKWSEYMKKNFL